VPVVLAHMLSVSRRVFRYGKRTRMGCLSFCKPARSMEDPLRYEIFQRTDLRVADPVVKLVAVCVNTAQLQSGTHTILSHHALIATVLIDAVHHPEHHMGSNKLESEIILNSTLAVGFLETTL
jgi:hypothetical protein